MLNHCYIFPLISIQCLTNWVPYRSSLIICCILCALDRSQQDTPRGNLLTTKGCRFLLRYHLYTFEDHFEDHFEDYVEPVWSSDLILHISRVILPQDTLVLTFQRPASHVGMNMCYSRVSLRYTICLQIIRMKKNLWWIPNASGMSPQVKTMPFAPSPSHHHFNTLGGIFTISSHGWETWHCFTHMIFPTSHAGPNQPPIWKKPRFVWKTSASLPHVTYVCNENKSQPYRMGPHS